MSATSASTPIRCRFAIVSDYWFTAICQAQVGSAAAIKAGEKFAANLRQSAGTTRWNVIRDVPGVPVHLASIAP